MLNKYYHLHLFIASCFIFIFTSFVSARNFYYAKNSLVSLRVTYDKNIRSEPLNKFKAKLDTILLAYAEEKQDFRFIPSDSKPENLSYLVDISIDSILINQEIPKNSKLLVTVQIISKFDTVFIFRKYIPYPSSDPGNYDSQLSVLLSQLTQLLYERLPFIMIKGSYIGPFGRLSIVNLAFSGSKNGKEPALDITAFARKPFLPFCHFGASFNVKSYFIRDSMFDLTVFGIGLGPSLQLAKEDFPLSIVANLELPYGRTISGDIGGMLYGIWLHQSIMLCMGKNNSIVITAGIYERKTWLDLYCIKDIGFRGSIGISLIDEDWEYYGKQKEADGDSKK
jgi:hypothetical protein